MKKRWPALIGITAPPRRRNRFAGILRLTRAG